MPNRIWLILGAVVLGLLALTIWLGITLLFWLFDQLPLVTETGKRLVGDTLKQIEQAVPGLKERLGEWVPSPGREAPASNP